MSRIRRLTVAALVLAAGLACAGAASSGPILDWLFPDDGPEPTYSKMRYWAPGLGRVNDDFHGPKLSVAPPDRHPEITPTYLIMTFPCPTATAADTIIQRPTAPPESKFKY